MRPAWQRSRGREGRPTPRRPETAPEKPEELPLLSSSLRISHELRRRIAGRDSPESYGFSAAPMISPDTTISTRRFFARPSAVSLDSTGWVFPKPAAVIASAETFWLIR
jgi:hypothetical protein